MGGVVVVLFMMSFVTRKGPHAVKPPAPDSVVLVSIQPKEVLPPPPPPVHVQQVATVRDVTIRIVPDNVKTDPIPENKDLDSARIGKVTGAGPADDVVGPPEPVGKGVGNVVETPKPAEDDGIYRTVEIESTYPGGLPAWARFLNKSFRYPDAAQSNGTQGTVMVRFIVDKEGNVSDVEAISGPDQDGLREEAVRVIKKSGKWVPAVQNGRNVKSYKQQPVVFKIAD